MSNQPDGKDDGLGSWSDCEVVVRSTSLVFIIGGQAD